MQLLKNSVKKGKFILSHGEYRKLSNSMGGSTTSRSFSTISKEWNWKKNEKNPKKTRTKLVKTKQLPQHLHFSPGLPKAEKMEKFKQTDPKAKGT